MRITPAAAGAAGATAGLVGLARRYRRDLAGAEDRLLGLDRRVIDTEFGKLEYAEMGSGEVVLVSHGIFHGFDGGLLSVRDLIEKHRIVVPSRFGYLGSTLPVGATGASQADAFVALLDALDLPAVDVIAISAGTSAAIQLALRHRERVGRLVVSSGNFPGSTTSQAPPAWAKVLYTDPAMWALETLMRPMFSKLMGIPRGFPRNDAEARVVDDMLASIFPVEPRADGAIFDAYVSNPEINTYSLEARQVPTLLVHARDDPLASYDAAVKASKRILNSILVSLESGGHLQLEQTARVRAEVASLSRRLTARLRASSRRATPSWPEPWSVRRLARGLVAAWGPWRRSRPASRSGRAGHWSCRARRGRRPPRARGHHPRGTDTYAARRLFRY